MAVGIPQGHFARAPGRLVHILKKPQAPFLQLESRAVDVVDGEIEMEMLAVAREGDRGIRVVDPLEVERLAPGADAGVEILVAEGELEAELIRIEGDAAIE